jgi:hypothetical protein
VMGQRERYSVQRKWRRRVREQTNLVEILQVLMAGVVRVEERMFSTRCNIIAVFLNRRAAARYRALASIIPGR